MTETENKKDVIIRPAEKKDEMAIEIILSTYFLDRDDIPHNDFYVAETNGKIIGCAVFEKLKSIKTGISFYEIHTIAVMPSFKGKGYGKLLLNRLIEEIEKDRAASPEMTSDTIYTRTTAPHFFEHLGFEKQAECVKKELWEECISCESHDNCNQTVLAKRLESK
ncbi:GNAT family N-acetyltransferase [Methanimicrococcus blatticola]|uniref:Amino-acid N-acetyltransferase n=1 Tax=Methanimicrococcus blatticola TaxID=91560 RepID=A0A484F614_9EURY|nr:GNAT family N-acetyltransferase [Methanimicrococcus blatticola]MBZ3936313.1 GNAT family N-acetyltransferase [Methanimicrococcus blatticola]MCC2508317.1 GNAT family N-acetyltransferase [Methanimicrococcus blatticola]TDQ70229.1 amino-acid N-acetyltransferase [Methanimicrococcus blatticola]